MKRAEARAPLVAGGAPGTDALYRLRSFVIGALMCALSLWLSASVLVAGELTANLDRNVISLGESVTLTLDFEGVSPGGTPSLPAIAGITVAGVSQSSSFTIINGQTAAKLSFSYTLVPSQTGEITIPSMRIRVDNRDLATQPLKLKVLATGAVPAPETANKYAFLKLLLPKTNLFIGEALPVDITLYFTEIREGHQPQLESAGFTVGKVQQQGQSRTRVGNQVFNLVTFKTYVSPVRSGSLQIGPVTMQLSVPKANARRTIFGDVFDWQPVTLSTEPQVINVSPLPRTNVPPTFNGAVGSYSMSVTAGPTNLAVGDPITAKVAISGQGLLDSLNLPNQPTWADFKVYPPNAKVEAADPLGLSGRKTFEQVVIPQKAEVSLLPPFQFSFFDPNARTYRTLSGSAVPLTVRPAAAVANLPTLAQSQGSTATNDEIVHIKPYLGVSPVAGGPLVQQPWFLALQAIPLVTWLSLLFVRKSHEALANNPRLRRQREVSRKIADGLGDLRRQAAAQESDAFFATVFRLLQEQLGERLDVPASAITEAVIDERLRTRNVPDETLRRLQELFQVCNQARYAPQRTSHELASYIARVETTLKELQNIRT